MLQLKDNTLVNPMLEIFESTQKYGCPVKTARHPALLTYIQQIVRSIRVELQKVCLAFR